MNVVGSKGSTKSTMNKGREMNMAKTDNSIIVESKAFSLKALFADKFTVDFYQREYVWTRKQIEDLIMDLSTEFLKQWEPGHVVKDVSGYRAD